MDYRNCPRFIEAEKYLNDHYIVELIHNLTSLVLFNQPENPCEYMISVLKKLKAAQSGHGENPFIFTPANAESIFQMMDPNNQGFITFEQYKHGLETLGITNYDLMPRNIAKNAITKEDFMVEALKGLDEMSSTYMHLPGFVSAHVEGDRKEDSNKDQCNC